MSTIERLCLALWQYCILKEKLDLILGPDYVRVYKSDFSLIINHNDSFWFVDYKKFRKKICIDIAMRNERVEENMPLEQLKRHLIPRFDRERTLKLTALFHVEWSLGLSTNLCDIYVSKITGDCTVDFIPNHRETALLDIKNQT